MFEQITDVFRRTGRSVPVYNDKHLSFSWDNAEWMYGHSRELEFPLMAGSSVPVTWRRPPLAFLPGVPLETALAAGTSSFESYGFHCLELLQTFVEKRQGGETGVKALQAIEGEEALTAARQRRWPAHLLPAAMQPVPASEKREFDFERLRNSVVFRIEYSDGFEAAVCLTGGLVRDYCFAASLRGRTEPVATCAHLPIPQRDHFSFLCNHIEVMFRSGAPSYPVERTLLVTGILDALHDSRAAGGRNPQLLPAGIAVGRFAGRGGAECRAAVTAAESVERLRNWASGRCLGADTPGIYQRLSEIYFCLVITHRMMDGNERTEYGLYLENRPRRHGQ